MIARIVCWVGLAIISLLALLAWQSVPQERPIASFATSVNGRSFSQRHNALLAARSIDGRIIKPGGVFSYNACVGSFSADTGYRKAPVSYNGQLIDDWGGGVCQTSTTLYNAALLAGLEILERNRHQFCPSYVEPGRDAAVAYPSIDLRLRNPYAFPIRIHATVDRELVRIDLIASQVLPHPVSVVAQVSRTIKPSTFVIGEKGGSRFVRNSGKAGYETRVFRRIGGREELVSQDSYPVMNRLLEYR